jgi:hypothetical protein
MEFIELIGSGKKGRHWSYADSNRRGTLAPAAVVIFQPDEPNKPNKPNKLFLISEEASFDRT